MNLACRRIAQLALPLALVIAVAVPRVAAAGDWVERKFDPPVGSKWVVNRELDVEKNTGGTSVGHTT